MVSSTSGIAEGTGSETALLLFALLVVNVETAPRLLAVPTGGDEVTKDDGGAVFVVAEVAMQNFGDGEHGVEADEIGELERAHGVIESEPHPLIDVLRRGHAVFEGIASFVE